MAPFISQMVKDSSNPLTHYLKPSMRPTFCKKNHSNQIRNKDFGNCRNVHFRPPLAPYISKTVKDSSNPLTHYRKPSMKPTFCKKNRSNRIKNKDFRNFRNMRFWPLSVLNISKTVKGTSNLIESNR